LWFFSLDLCPFFNDQLTVFEYLAEMKRTPGNYVSAAFNGILKKKRNLLAALFQEKTLQC